MDLESLDKWARIKGIKVLGTGDFTHPEWFGNLKNKSLQPKNKPKNDFVFNQLNEIDVILGQVFKVEGDFIAEVELDINVIKTGTRWR